MLDLLRKYVIEITIDAHIATVFDTCAAVEGFSKKLLTCSILAPIATFIRRKTNTAMHEKKYSMGYG